MSEYFDMIKENWRILAIGGLAVAFFGYDKLKALAGKVNLPALNPFKRDKSVQTEKDVEMEDIYCINHLRDRAVVAGDETLLLDIKSISQKFFDIHAATKNEKK